MLGEYKAVTDAEKAEVVALGGLHVVGTERHESRRIDNQLRGRSGRQGDPGSTRCVVVCICMCLFFWGGHLGRVCVVKQYQDDHGPTIVDEFKAAPCLSAVIRYKHPVTAQPNAPGLF
jgi:hypothetical protein